MRSGRRPKGTACREGGSLDFFQQSLGCRVCGQGQQHTGGALSIAISAEGLGLVKARAFLIR